MRPTGCPGRCGPRPEPSRRRTRRSRPACSGCPTDEELAAAVGLSVDQLHSALSEISATGLVALDEATALGDVLADRADGPAGVLEQVETRRGPGRAPSTACPSGSASVLVHYYVNDLTLAQIGDGLGVTESRVSQIHAKAVIHLRVPPGCRRAERLSGPPGRRSVRARANRPCHLAAHGRRRSLEPKERAMARRPLRPGRGAARRRPPSPTSHRSTRRSSTTSGRRRARGAQATGASTTPPRPARRSARRPPASSRSPARSAASSSSSIAHADGLRTTYAYLADVTVHGRPAVAQGAVVGTALASLHFGVRRGDVYLDPELLFAGGRARGPARAARRPPAARAGRSPWRCDGVGGPAGAGGRAR